MNQQASQATDAKFISAEDVAKARAVRDAIDAALAAYDSGTLPALKIEPPVIVELANQLPPPSPRIAELKARADAAISGQRNANTAAATVAQVLEIASRVAGIVIPLAAILLAAAPVADSDGSGPEEDGAQPQEALV